MTKSVCKHPIEMKKAEKKSLNFNLKDLFEKILGKNLF
jgi:hypothetical protein